MINTQNVNWKRFATLFSIFLLVLSGSVSIFIYKSELIYLNTSKISNLWTSFIKDNVYPDKQTSEDKKVVFLERDIPIEEWKIYINDKYNYSIKYRPDFEVKELEDKSLVSIDNVKENELPTEKDYFVVFIKINSNDSGLSPEKYLELYARANEGCRKEILNSFSMYKNNYVVGVKGNADPCSETPDYTAIFTDKNYAYIVDLKSNSAFDPFYTKNKLDIFEKMIFTFNIK